MGFYIIPGGGSGAGGAGDMTKAVYDSDDDGYVAAAESLNDGTDSLTISQIRQLFTSQLGDTGVISGLGVAYSGSGLVYDIGPGSFQIGGTTYTSSGGQVTLTAADATNPRIDLFVVNTDGTVDSVDGTAAASPVLPSHDAATQVVLTFAYVPATATVPPGVVVTSIYDEDNDWTTTESNASIVSDSTNNPRSGTKCIEITNASNGHNIVFDKGSTLDITNLSILPLWIRSKGAFGSRSLQLQWLNSANATRGSVVTITNNRFGFSDTNTTSYQLLVIPFSSFNLTSADVPRKLRIRVNGSGTFTGCYIDDITLQTSMQPVFVTGSVLPFSDSETILKNASDTSKQAKFDLSGLTTNTTRTLTLPNTNATLATNNTAETFSATKTFAGAAAASNPNLVNIQNTAQGVIGGLSIYNTLNQGTGSWNSSAYSQSALSSSGFFAWKLTWESGSGGRFVGVGYTSPANASRAYDGAGEPDGDEIDYYFFITTDATDASGSYQIRKASDNSTVVGATAFTQSTAKFEIRRSGTSVYFVVNNAIVYTVSGVSYDIHLKMLFNGGSGGETGSVAGINTVTSSQFSTAPQDQCIIVRPANAPTASLKVLDVQTYGTTTSVASIDAEGDAIVNNLTVSGSLSGGIKCKVQKSAANQTISNITNTSITFDAEVEDSTGMHDTGSNTNRITFATAGTYLLGAQVYWHNNSTGNRILNIFNNTGGIIAGSVIQAPGAGDFHVQQTCGYYVAAASDWAEVSVYQSSGGDLDVKNTAGYTHFWAVKIG